MPQMAPILWFPLFLFMVCLVMLAMCSTFFDKKVEQSSIAISHSVDKNNWLW